MPLTRSRSTVFLQSDVSNGLPRAYSSSNLTAWATKPYDPSWHSSLPYDNYSWYLNNYVPTYYLSKYYPRQNISDDFWYRSYLPTTHSLRYSDRVRTAYFPRLRMYGRSRFYDCPYRYQHYERYPLYSF